MNNRTSKSEVFFVGIEKQTIQMNSLSYETIMDDYASQPLTSLYFLRSSERLSQ